MELFNEKTFAETYSFFKEMGLHHTENSPAKKQEMLLDIVHTFCATLEKYEKKDRALEADKLLNETNEKVFLIRFETSVKGSWEDQLAKTILMCFDFVGCWRLKKSSIDKGYEEIFREREKLYLDSAKETVASYEKEFDNNVQTNIKSIKAYGLPIIKCLTDVYYNAFGGNDMGTVIARLHLLAIATEVNVKKHMDLRLKYMRWK